VFVCVRETEREKERESEREWERERESEREKERDCVCVHLCIHKVRRGTQVKGTKRMKTQLALRLHEDVTVRHNGCCCMQMLADRALYDWQARLQRVPVVVALAPAHHEVAALDNVLVEDARVCRGHWLALRPHALQSAPGSRCSPTSPSSAAWSHLDLHLRATHCTRRVRRLEDQPRAPTPRRRHFEIPAFWDSNSKKEKKFFFQLLSIQPTRATQSMMYLPLRVNRFQIIILLTIKYKYSKSCSKHFILQNLILDKRLCSTEFITQPSWLSDFCLTNMIRQKRFVLAVYQ